MISKKQLNSIAIETGLQLYQQEKDYLLKLFLYFYYKNFDTAVFKGGTCLKYVLNLNRFSEDLDFNVQNKKEFQKEVEKTLQGFRAIGIKTYFRKQEIFEDSYTCEIGFEGPLHIGGKQTENKIRIDAGYRTGTFRKPQWKFIKSTYPETTTQFLVKAMDIEELFIEKILAMRNRDKGRDVYDVWFLLQASTKFDKKLFEKKRKKEKIGSKKINIPSKETYERDMKRLTNRVIPYAQIKKEVDAFLENFVR